MINVELAKGLSIKRGEDGHWLNFTSSSGKHASINLESNFGNSRIIGDAILGWAQDICKPAVKKIDMSVCIESGIDCEFSKAPSFIDSQQRKYLVRKLSGIDKQGCYMNDNENWFNVCRPRMNHIHASPNGWDKCPIPEGFKVRVFGKYVEEEGVVTSNMDSIRWARINMFEVIELTEGYEL